MFLLQGNPTASTFMALLHEAVRLETLAADLRAIASSSAPVPTALEEAPILDGWRIVWRSVPHLQAAMIGHPMEPDGPKITSEVAVLDPKRNWMRAGDRFYALGQHARATTAEVADHE